MKKVISILAAVAALTFSVQAYQTWPGTLINGYAYTNATVPLLNPGTNSPASTNQIGVVLGAGTNFYTPSTGLGIQATNQSWPSLGFTLQSQYPNTFAPGANNFCVGIDGNLMATNSSSTTITVRWAASADGVLWVSNYWIQAYIVAVNTTSPGLLLTNFSTGAVPYMALQEIDNPGVAALTNVVISANSKPGL